MGRVTITIEFKNEDEAKLFHKKMTQLISHNYFGNIPLTIGVKNE